MNRLGHDWHKNNHANSTQNGGYINPPRVKRQHRDPYAQWWDPQERRNFGEPVHEDNDVLGIFSPWDYTWTTTGPGLIMIGTFVATFLGVCGIVYLNYPDRPSYPREFEGGLEKELGGPGAVRVRPKTSMRALLDAANTFLLGTHGGRRGALNSTTKTEPRSLLYINRPGIGRKEGLLSFFVVRLFGPAEARRGVALLK